MIRSYDKSDAAAFLRQKAEELQKQKSIANATCFSETDTLKLFHELEVHEIELKLQNEELEAAIEQAEVAAKKYRELYDFAPSGYFTLSRDGGIIELNLCGARMLGKKRSSLKNGLLGFFISDETKPIFGLFIENVFKSKERESCDVTLSTNADSPMYVHLSGMVDQTGEQCLATMVDITERKLAEIEHLNYIRQLQQNQRLESLGVLAGGIAHDFNNLMGGIYGYIDLAKAESDTSKISELLSNAMETIDRARGLTRQLLTFAKGGAPVLKTALMAPIIREAAKFALCGSSVSCRIDVPEILRACNVDKDQIGQVVDNLIINAQQAMPSGGNIDLVARNVSFGEKEHPFLKKGYYVKISIKDNGTGIPKEILPRIFDPYYTTKKKGHGLGLATCFSIIKRHGGAIEVESEPGKGSEFVFYLPVSEKTAPDEPLKVTTGFKGSGAIEDVETEPGKGGEFLVYLPASEKTTLDEPLKAQAGFRGSGVIMIMDDEKVIREILKAMLALIGFSVVCTKDGRETVDLFIAETNAGRTFKALIFDLTVQGGLGGREAIAEIRKADPEIPVFVSSGYADDPVMQHPADYGFTASISKPFRISELTGILEKHLRK